MQGRATGRRPRPAAAALAAAGLLALGGGALAFAADGPPPDKPEADSIDLGMSTYDYTFAPTAAGAAPVTRLVTATMFHHDPNAAVPVQQLTVSAAGLRNIAAVVWPKSCTVAGSGAVCTVPGVPVGTLRLPDLGVGVRPLPGVAAGAKGSLTVSHRNTDGRTRTVEATVTLTDGPSLAVGRAPTTTLTPGARGDVPVTVTNEGNRQLTALRLDYTWTHGLAPVQRFSNCRYDTSLDQVTGVHRTDAHCAVDQPLAPGASYGVRDVIAVKAGADAYAENVDVSASVPGATDPTPPGVPGTGPVLRLVPVAGGTPGAPGRNDTSYGGGADFRVTNTADFGLSAPAVTGAKSAEVKVTVRVDNHGPAAIDPAEYFLSVARFDLQVPTGTELVAWPRECEPRDTAQRYLRCSSETESDVERPVTLFPGHSYDFELTLRVTSAGSHTGEARLLTAGPNRVELPFDHIAANNTTQIIVNAPSTGGGSTAGAAGSAGTQSAGGASGTGGTGGGTGTVSLPATGAGGTPLTAGLAAGAVLLGGATLFTVRRRQHT
jgi:LPXTG-motif cell wall-anchored protein